MRRAADGPLIGIASVAFAVVCCAGLPAIGALIGGISIVAVPGIAGGVVAFTAAAAAAAAVLVLRVRRRRFRPPPHQGEPVT